ncbi:hypothetical protein ACIQ2D_15050 [Lysinibacillus sp. NPDC097287]|uniref:hypothetical protein n=1 Tax=Lysinibacillus sp. NPDC097287 TaxID=3364144 RepID=UPI00380A4643
MRIYKLAYIGTFILLLSGCNAFSAPTEESTAKVESTVASKEVSEESTEVVKKEPVILDVTEMEKYQDPMGGFNPLVIDAEIASPMGDHKSYFSYSGDMPFKLSLSNTGTESFLFKIQNVDKELLVTNGVLGSNESYDKIFDGFPEGDYVISFVVEEEEPPSDIKLKVKLEYLPW